MPFLRHFSLPHNKVPELTKNVQLKTIVDPDIGCYKSTVDRSSFPPSIVQDPVKFDLDPYETAIYRMLSNYEDVLHCSRFPHDDSLRKLFCAHALKHALRVRKLVVKNNEKEKKNGVSDSLRDQGFHRAHTLILAPTKEAARRIVYTFLRLMPKGSTVSHRRRFEQDFGPQPGETDAEKRKGQKPSDYEEWFSCNSGDHFRIGLTFAKNSVKLYSPFANSDLILASPLGLKTIIDDKDDKTADLQYITASTELLIIDQAEMLLMQNWANVQYIVGLLNQRPKLASFASAARIRLSYLAGYGRCYRQTLIFSAVLSPLIQLLIGECENFQGVNFIPPVPHYFDLHQLFQTGHSRPPQLGAQSHNTTTNPSRPGSKRTKSDAVQLALPSVKVKLIGFTVAGQVNSLGPQWSTDNVGDDDDEIDNKVRPENEAISDIGATCPLEPVIDSCRPIPETDLTYLAGRAIPIGRLGSFRQRILPKLRRSSDPGVLIYVPDYYDLEELRSLLLAESLDVCCIHEYTADTEADRFRTLFAADRIRILLLSERYYFFRRRKIRGVRSIIFYAPPTFPWFIKELLDVRPRAGDNEDSGCQSSEMEMTFLYYPPLEAQQMALITGRIDL